MLVGNKSDLDSEIDPTTAKSFANAHEFELQYQTSCKANSGIATAFDQLAKELHRSATGTGGAAGGQGGNKAIELPTVDDLEHRKGGGCKC